MRFAHLCSYTPCACEGERRLPARKQGAHVGMGGGTNGSPRGSHRIPNWSTCQHVNIVNGDLSSKKTEFCTFYCTVLYEDQYRYDCFTCLNILYSRPAFANRADMVLSARLSPIRLLPALTYKLYAEFFITVTYQLPLLF